MVKSIKVIPKNFVDFPEAIVLDNSEKWIKELYKEADAKTAEKFGRDSLAYKTITNGIDTKNVTGSQFFWNTNLGFYMPKNKRVVSLKDMENINDLDENFFKGFYSDAPQIVLRSDKDSYEKNQQVLENLVKHVKGDGFNYSPEIPLVISNLRLVKDENPKNLYGLLLELGDATVLENDSRFAYSKNGEKITFGENEKTVYTKNNGLSRVYLGNDGDLFVYDDDLAVSDDYGRVVAVSDAVGVAAKIFEEYKTNLEKERQKQIDKINSNYEEAMKILKS